MNIQMTQSSNSNGVVVTDKYIQYSNSERIEIPKKVRKLGYNQSTIDGEVYINGWHYNRKSKEWEDSIKGNIKQFVKSNTEKLKKKLDKMEQRNSLPEANINVPMPKVKPAKENDNDNYWLMRQFRNLACGCKDHPSYRTKCKPTTKCGRCNDMWLISQDIIKQYGDWFD